ncbi:protein CREG1-like [Pollicipes pollicipes]|uniref:protein CREG1-like n=1 Tax=Pollicipes pollicipes TaxID=41117 RepID=UPI001885204C|nr:protein CREG1-like [Pollicipes pollicipes]
MTMDTQTAAWTDTRTKTRTDITDRHADKRHGHSEQQAPDARYHQNGGSEAHRRGDMHRASQAEPARERGPASALPHPPAAPQPAADEPAVDEPAANELIVDEPAVALGSDGEAAPAIVPPPHEQVAAMARYVVHVSDWTAMATISSREPTRGMPFANVFSVADGTRYRSTGVPYLYLTDMEISVKDLRVNNNASLTMSLAQTTFCQQHDYDPEDPLCAHVILSGRVLQVDPDEPEYTFARDALFARHPEMPDWPVGHNWFVAKLDIMDIIVLDFFGGAKTVNTVDYFAADPFKIDPRLVNRV